MLSDEVGEGEGRFAEQPSDACVEDQIANDDAAGEPLRPAILPVVNVHDLDWNAVRDAVSPGSLSERIRDTVARVEAFYDGGAPPGLLFDAFRASAEDRAISVTEWEDDTPLWFIGDLHGDLLALEAALALIQRERGAETRQPRIVFLGDFFDDGGFPVEVVMRVFELIAENQASVCLIAGNHDEALGFDGGRFFASVSPSDFSEYLNQHISDETILALGKLLVRVFAQAPRAIFLPDGLLVSHGGFPLADLHAGLEETGDWNDERCLSDFVWTRAHPRARRKIPNRVSRGCQFGHEDFSAFCAVSARLGRPVTHMVRGHDHVEERYEIYPAYAANPILTTVALSRRLAREAFGTYERVPTIARWVRGALPEVYRLHVPPEMVRTIFPDPDSEPNAPDAVHERERPAEMPEAMVADDAIAGPEPE